MEEKKAKKVKLGNKEGNKLTYEQLNDACNQLLQQNQQLYRQLKEVDMANMFKRLDYLFKVVENANTFKDGDFLNSCMDEIKEALTIPREEATSTKENMQGKD